MIAAYSGQIRSLRLVAIGLLFTFPSCGVHLQSRVTAPERRTETTLGVPIAGDDGPAEPVSASPKRSKPQTFLGRGSIVCLLEEIERIHQATIDTGHAHVFAFRVASEGRTRYYPLLPTEQSKALFADERLRAYELILSGVVYPEGNVFDVGGWRGVRDDTLLDVYYWCEVCSIRGIDPGPCACCQGEVVLREKELGKLNESNR